MVKSKEKILQTSSSYPTITFNENGIMILARREVPYNIIIEALISFTVFGISRNNGLHVSILLRISVAGQSVCIELSARIRPVNKLSSV